MRHLMQFVLLFAVVVAIFNSCARENSEEGEPIIEGV